MWSCLGSVYLLQAKSQSHAWRKSLPGQQLLSTCCLYCFLTAGDRQQWQCLSSADGTECPFKPAAAEGSGAETSRAVANQSCREKQLLTNGACNCLFSPFASFPCPPSLALCFSPGYSISSFLQMLHPECKNIPEPNLLPGQLSHGAVGVKDGKVQWISMAFESVSTTIYPCDSFWGVSPALSAVIPLICSHNLVFGPHSTDATSQVAGSGCVRHSWLLP